jgi:hypothetical protein
MAMRHNTILVQKKQVLTIYSSGRFGWNFNYEQTYLRFFTFIIFAWTVMPARARELKSAVMEAKLL